MWMRRAVLLLLPLVAGCLRSARPDPVSPLTAEEIAARMPARAHDAEGWARDLMLAFDLDRLPLDEAHVCAVIAVVDQESGFHANPEVPHLAAIARRELSERLARFGPLAEPVL